MSSQAEEQWPWLGLLKWSLTYVDGTVPSEESEDFKKMSKEDIAFLEEVMKNGIIDEGDRMKKILKHLVTYFEHVQGGPGVKAVEEEKTSQDEKDEFADPLSVDEIEELLQELQDIVEQIDFAKSFSTMGGISFLIGCSSQSTKVPTKIRAACLAVLGTMTQNNPAVQYTMLEQGNIPKLVDTFFAEYLRDDAEDASMIQARALQAMSCSVRNHDIGEKIFCMNTEAQKMVEASLGLYSHKSETEKVKEALPKPSDNMRRKALFFMQALVTSDSADSERICLFNNAIQYVASRFIDKGIESNADIREMALSMLTRILDQKKSVNAVLDVKSYLVTLGIKSIAEMRKLKGEEKELFGEELRLWEMLISQLSRAVRDEANPDHEASSSSSPLLLGS